jgi:hypothetical protein
LTRGYRPFGKDALLAAKSSVTTAKDEWPLPDCDPILSDFWVGVRRYRERIDWLRDARLPVRISDVSRMKQKFGWLAPTRLEMRSVQFDDVSPRRHLGRWAELGGVAEIVSIGQRLRIRSVEEWRRPGGGHPPGICLLR